jgi:hypothetical protein
VALDINTTRDWIVELTVLASIHNSPVLREVANALDEGITTGRLYFEFNNLERDTNEQLSTITQ